MTDVAGVHFVPIRRKGKPTRWYVYAWRGGPRIMTATGESKPRLGPAELAAIARHGAELTAPKDEGLLSGLSRRWRGLLPAQASPEWKGLSEGTRTLWGYHLDAIEAKWGETPLAVWDDVRMVGKVIEWRDSRADSPRSADIGVQVLAELLAFGKLRAMLRINVAADVPAIYEQADRAEIVWTDDDLEAFCWSAIALDRPEMIDVIWLACLTGMRRADLAAVTWDEVSDHAIVRTALKKSKGRRRRAVVPLLRESRELLDELRGRPRNTGVRNVLVTKSGGAWNAASLTARFYEVRNAANGGRGIVHAGNAEIGEPDRAKHLHDCRGTFTTKLCRTDLTNEEMARILAWSPQNVERIRRTYVDDAAVVVALADRIRKAEGL